MCLLVVGCGCCRGWLLFVIETWLFSLSCLLCVIVRRCAFLYVVVSCYLCILCCVGCCVTCFVCQASCVLFLLCGLLLLPLAIAGRSGLWPTAVYTAGYRWSRYDYVITTGNGHCWIWIWQTQKKTIKIIEMLLVILSMMLSTAMALMDSALSSVWCWSTSVNNLKLQTERCGTASNIEASTCQVSTLHPSQYGTGKLWKTMLQCWCSSAEW